MTDERRTPSNLWEGRGGRGGGGGSERGEGGGERDERREKNKKKKKKNLSVGTEGKTISSLSRSKVIERVSFCESLSTSKKVVTIWPSIEIKISPTLRNFPAEAP